MPRPRRLSLSLKRQSALTISRISIGSNKLVYVLVANKPLRYTGGRSKIAYIGTTKNGLSRVALSVASRARDILGLHGVDAFEARIVTCPPRQRIKTWHKLERALLLAFKEKFGEVPACNSHGKNMRETDEYEYFTRSAAKRVIEDLS